jgi:hypothetical protein
MFQPKTALRFSALLAVVALCIAYEGLFMALSITYKVSE